MQPSMRLRVAAGAPPQVTPVVPKGGAVASKYVAIATYPYISYMSTEANPVINHRILLPAIAWLGAAGLVGLYVSRQLHQRSVGFDDIFSQQNTPEVEEARKRGLLVDTYGDPRNSLLNVLGWTK
ncbi:hypothetical protein RRF57_008673 [Xylaria bambusicola]|uniref:Uncharacterized protein n=1 Tax=Xylaria bambusicola TaxID=326684 RepID=A0AAN7V1Y9_9PEZI